MTAPQPNEQAPENLYGLLQSRSQDRDEQVFLEVPNGRNWTYGQAHQHAARLAGLLRQLGVQPGDRVAVQVDKSPEAICLYLACLRAGAVFLPLNTAYMRTELEYFLHDAEPSLAVVRPAGEETLRELAEAKGGTRVETLDANGGGSLMRTLSEQAPEPLPPHPVSRDDLACILYTSGTTGRPKGAMLSHGNLAANALALEEAWGWRQDDVLIHALPIFHVHGLFVAMHCAMMGASKVYFLPRFDADQVLQLLPRATVLMGVPTFYTRLLQQPELNPELCRNMRLFISGSAPLLEETFQQWYERTGHPILERYGMTETGMNISNPLEGERRPGTVGFPLPGVEVRIVDTEGHELPPGEVGSLQVKGPNVFSGYWRLPEKTAEEFTDDGYFITGDMATVSEDGYYAIVGRAKDLVITGGYNVYPKEVEGFIDGLDGVRESAVIGLPHPDFGEQVAAVVVPEKAGPKLDEAAVIHQLKGELAGYKVPKAVFFVDELPRNAMGKVQKNVLREQYTR
ncbi:malonate--CoA ligase [Alkalilimnicola ehrlichii MLHE-1]|uniref:AMP-dependent synthetase and ligase n=1 Tax=Alkalilimnicola ehrlichii (strain ATCC BAA-1101 / DSM 17681 / MLHE-1) TaxID=187272 RepID=Q0A4V7_ALKEH|nr:malonyl-CoA synthase [Alkalilimnicola ehrlichii]ABI58130.1 AMP-dependent synthetase and ligase [Alkalilimnicola ehrlichii MLHE-1]